MAASNPTIPRLTVFRSLPGARPHTSAGWAACVAFAAALPLFSPAQESESGKDRSQPYSVLTYLEPYRSIEMSPAESGVIREILVKEGDRVIKGQPLLKLDAEVIEARLAVAMAQADNMGAVLVAESQHKLEKDRYEKLQSLGGQASQYELEQQLAQMKSAEGNLTQALEQKRIFQLQADQARAELERRILKSPIDGIVVEIVKDVAEAVSPIESSRDEYLIRVVKIDQLQAEAHLPARWAVPLKEGDEMKLRIEGEGDPRDGQEISGTIEYISPIIDSASGTRRVRLMIDNSSGIIVPGSAAQLLLRSP